MKFGKLILVWSLSNDFLLKIQDNSNKVLRVELVRNEVGTWRGRELYRDKQPRRMK